MSDWLILLDYCTFAWLCVWAIRALRDISSGERRPISFISLVFFLFYGIPILLDVTIGIPEHPITPGLRSPAESEQVAVIYDLFVAACPVFWWFTARPRRRTAQRLFLLTGKKAEPVLWFLLVSPVIALLRAPNPSAYLNYAAVLGGSMSEAAMGFHAIIGALSIISLVAGNGLLLVRRSFGRTLCFIAPFMLLSVWVQGKRSIVALAMALIWTACWTRGLINRSRLLEFGTLTLILFAGYVYWYQTTFRPDAVSTGGNTYQGIRTDFGRDQDLKAAIYCELPDVSRPMLEYRGQSILFSLAMYVPRSSWPDKPWPYAVYVTAYALEIPVSDLGWGLTTGFLDEAVANFGWAGLLIGPLVFSLLCRTCDKSPDPIVKTSGLLVACFLMTVEFVAFAPLAIAWILYSTWANYKVTHKPGRLFSAAEHIWLVGRAR